MQRTLHSGVGAGAWCTGSSSQLPAVLMNKASRHWPLVLSPGHRGWVKALLSRRGGDLAALPGGRRQPGGCPDSSSCQCASLLSKAHALPLGIVTGLPARTLGQRPGR